MLDERMGERSASPAMSIGSVGSADSLDSLFEESADEAPDAPSDDVPITPASRTPPPIPGLFVFPSLLPPDVARTALNAISEADHFAGARDQVMLFSRARSEDATAALPPHIATLDGALAALLRPRLPPEVYGLAFAQEFGRQAILNLYAPGTGITPHVDLPGRYADGIVGASLAGGCVMTFTREAPGTCLSGVERGEGEGGGEGEEGRRRGKEGTEQQVKAQDTHHIYLPPRSVYVMTGAARWDWAHGIAYRAEDVVLEGGEERVIPRGLRLSVTLRWMKPGAGLLC